MNDYSLLISIVPRNHGSKITNSAKNAGIPGATILMGRGTAKNTFLQIFGLGDTEKDITYMIVEMSQKKHICDVIKNESFSHKSPYGILFSVPVKFIHKSTLDSKKDNSKIESKPEENLIMSDKQYVLITAIINAGYADDAMAAARSAGAGGGTVINARGTGTEKDASFFGISIVPEKEILEILVEKQKSISVVEAIKNLPCLSQPGSGIVYSNEVDDFIVLGKNK